MDSNIDAELDRIVEICKQRTMSIISIWSSNRVLTIERI
jgi:hypothetical protein